MSNAIKKYKNTLRNAFNAYQREFQDRIRNLKTTNWKEYWNIINGQSKSGQLPVNAPSINTFYEHLKKLNTSDEADVAANIDFIDAVHNDALNIPFTHAKIRAAIQSLKINKACGQDRILNEFLKHSIEPLTLVYTKLFNVILDTGIVPTEWCTGYIKPLYKNKGSVDSPDNYRGITILSCLGKLFTCVLNRRLYKFTSENSVVGAEQAGFKRGHSPIDHAFVLKTLLDYIWISVNVCTVILLTIRKLLIQSPRQNYGRKSYDAI